VSGQLASSLEKYFGFIHNPAGALFTEVITTLNAIIDNEEIHAIVKIRVLEYTEGLLKFETAVTAQVYMQLFSCTMPLCKLCDWIY